MAQLTITVPDIVVPRIRLALGHRDPLTQEWILATVEDIQAMIKQHIKSKVIDYETAQAATVKRDQVSQEDWS